MEVSGIVSRHIPCFSAAGVDSHHSSNLSFPGVSTVDAGNRVSKVSFRPRKLSGFSGSAFSDNGHLNYYHAPPRCGGKKEKGKGSDVITKTTKKKLKLLKGLSKDLSMFSELGFGADHSVLVGEVQGKIVSEAADVLLRQLQQVRAEEKELKRKKKLEKAQLKATRMRTMVESESSSSSSESSDSECGEVIQTSRLRKEAFVQPIVHELQAGAQEESTPILPISPAQEESTPILPISPAQEGKTTNKESIFEECCSGGSTSLVTGALAKRIEVCMGGKCKKSGAAELLEEFGKAIGVEGAVVGCKCMGKCRDGPNVKVLNCYDGVVAEGRDDSVGTPTNPLCIGVGLADVGIILGNFFGEDGRLAPAV